MLRTAIVGLGSWGRVLVNSVQGKDDDIVFTAGCTRTPEKAESFCRERGIRLRRALDEVIADPAVDAIVLATPNSQHVDQIRRVAQAGKHVFVEKPFSLTSDGARAAMDAVRAAGVVLGVGFNRRFHPSVRELRSRVKSGRLGVMCTIMAELTATTGFYRASDSWRVNPEEEPAGAMASIGVHLVDGMIDIGGRIREVHCVSEHRAGPHGDDSTSLLLKLENGGTGLAFCSFAAARNFRLAVYGSRGFAEVQKPTMETFRFIPAAEGRASHLARIPEPETIETPEFNSVAAELKQFAQSIREGKPYPIPVDEILHGVAVFEAAVRSAKTGQPVTVAE